MAPIQPWSAAGAEKPMVTALPGASSLPLAAAAAVAAAVVVDDAALLLVQAVRAAPAPSGAGAEEQAAAAEHAASRGTGTSLTSFVGLRVPAVCAPWPRACG